MRVVRVRIEGLGGSGRGTCLEPRGVHAGPGRPWAWAPPRPPPPTPCLEPPRGPGLFDLEDGAVPKSLGAKARARPGGRVVFVPRNVHGGCSAPPPSSPAAGTPSLGPPCPRGGAARLPLPGQPRDGAPRPGGQQ